MEGKVMSASLDIGEDNELVCNYKDKDAVGSCVDAGTCGIKPNQYGKTIGKCSAKDHMGQNKDCCSLTVPCGEASHSLVSYFHNPSWPDSEDKDTTCNIKIVVKPKVCQIRIDFLEFQLASPDEKSGACLSNNNMAIFTHSNPSGLLGGKNHGFCGNNKNQHLYIPCGYHDKINFMTTISKKSQDHHFEYKYDKHWFEEKKLYRRHVKYDRKDGSTRRYWCGKSLGPVNEVLSSPKLAILKVFSGKKSEEKLDSPACGFVIDYRIETGYC